MRERRYQLKKETAGLVRHVPWLFRDHMSSATAALGDGDRVKLFDGNNHVVGHGVYAADGAIAIRVVRAGEAAPDAAWLRARLDAALHKRAELAKQTTGVRLLHGESDSVPAIVADRFGDAVVVTSYATGFDGMARYVARWASVHGGVAGPASTVVVRRAHRRADAADDHPAPRALRGALAVARFDEGPLALHVDLAGGQKTGAYLDLRALRREVAAAPLAGKRVLNLFAYTGMIGRAAEHAGAASILQVDASAPALAFAQAHHVTDPSKHAFETADVFDWLPAHAATYELVIVDPPAMTSKAAQVPKVLAAYRSLYKAAASCVAPGGQLVAACCTSRVPRDAFRTTVAGALGAGFAHVKELPPEPDHPVGFPQADYLKIHTWRRTS
jgi:23S rRNA (cytosine1962-C5)-methyltransferase|nr:class I SAM-dependent methyltransferase [Kofleriaceae bacterium]